MRKMDLIIIICVLLIGGLFIGFNQYNAKIIEDKSSGLWAEISVKGQLYKVVSMTEEEQEIIIETELGKNVIKVHEKGIEVIEADCNDHICEKTGFKHKVNEMIVCLPNKVFIEIKGDMEGEIDGLSN